MTSQTVTILNNITVAAGATFTSDFIPLEDSLNGLSIYPRNDGASTKLTINFYSSHDGIHKAWLQPVILDNSSIPPVIYVVEVPSGLFVEAINNDTVNTTCSVDITKRA